MSHARFFTHSSPVVLCQVVDLFLVGSSVNSLSSNQSDADMCLMFKDRPDLMNQPVAAANLLQRISLLISKEGE